MGGFLQRAWCLLRGVATPDDLDRPLLDRLQTRWAAAGIKPRPGVSPEAIVWFEDRYQVVLQPAVRAYFEAVDGTGDEVDGHYFRFWPFAEFAPVAEDRSWGPGEAARFEGWFLFADHMIDAPDFAVRLSSEAAGVGPVACLYDAELLDVAPSFEAFLASYLAHPMGVVV